MMTNFCMMLAAFAVLCGAALFFCSILKLNMGEGMVLSTAACILLLFAGSTAGSFSYGIYGIIVLAVLGAALWIFTLAGRKRRHEEADYLTVSSPAFLILFGLFLGWMVVYYHDFIQHIDEFHQWAAAVKYMLNKDQMPFGTDFVGGAEQYAFATSLFHLLFQKFSGYNEQDMYVSASLLMWIGFLLPFAGCRRKEWKKAVLYTGIIYLAVYTLYLYGPKNMYVDLPTAAWAGGLGGWWLNRPKKRTDFLLAGTVMVLLYFMKPSVGMLMAVFVLGFILLQILFVENNFLEQAKGIRILTALAWGAGAMVVAGSGAVILLVRKYQPFSVGAYEVTGEKLKQTLMAFVVKSSGLALSSRSNLAVSFFALLLLVLILFRLGGELLERKKEAYAYILYSGVAALGYCAVLFFSFLFMFNYESSVNMRGCRRYFSICGLYLLMMALTFLLQRSPRTGKKHGRWLACGLLLFFALGVNEKFIPNATAIAKTDVANYTKISSTKSQTEKIASVLDEEDRVYLICQQNADTLSGADVILNTALYYLDNQISNYLNEPWKFFDGGSNVRLEDTDTWTLASLPDLLAQGGYEYVWIYKKDDYLTQHLPEVLKCDKVKQKSLYRVIYEDGRAAALEYVQTLK